MSSFLMAHQHRYGHSHANHTLNKADCSELHRIRA